MVMSDEEYKVKEKAIRDEIASLAQKRAEIFARPGMHWDELADITKQLEKIERRRTRLYNAYSPVLASGQTNRSTKLYPTPVKSAASQPLQPANQTSSKALTQESINKPRR